MIPESVNSWLQANRLSVILALVGIILIGAGIFWYRSGMVSSSKVEILSATTENTVSNSIYVDISGAVNKPGVYKVEAKTRISEVINMAGGISSDVNLEWVEKNLNQATVVKDGMKLYIPRKEENSQGQIELMKSSNESININSGSQSELESLPGIGPVTAAKIISGRPYQDTGELLSKKILGQKVFDQIQSQISTW